MKKTNENISPNVKYKMYCIVNSIIPAVHYTLKKKINNKRQYPA